MDTMPWMITALAAAVSAGASALVCRWWYGRRVGEMHARMQKVEQSRQVAAQHTTQMRRQIELLQKEIAAQHKARAEARAEARAARKKQALAESLDAAERTVVLGHGGSRPMHGFADTLPM